MALGHQPVLGREETLIPSTPFELLLFCTDAEKVRLASEAGVDGFIVDWERLGKEDRQNGADTQINYDTEEDLARVRGATAAKVICRINGFGDHTRGDVERAVAAGADELLLPMVRKVEDVERVLEMAGGNCRVGILVETVAALGICDRLGRLPLARVYVGLNDLAIERGHRNIFTSVADGTVEKVRSSFAVPFGFAGLTVPDRGWPIPCRLLIGEMARQRCSFSFLRRSFWSDVDWGDVRQGIEAIRSALESAGRRTSAQAERERSDLVRAIESWDGARVAPD